MIGQKLVDNIRAYGIYTGSWEGRRKVLEDAGFGMDKKAKYVIITGCVLPEEMPHVFRAFKSLLDHLQIDYTLLSKEYCCGWVPLRRPAVAAKNEEDIIKTKELSREFVMENFRQAEALEASSIVLFCAACEPTYTNFAGATSLEVISYSELLDRHFQGGKLDIDADYYAGCYRFRRRITTEPVDVEPAVRLLNKIEGLRVNYLDNNLCCFKPSHVEQLVSSLTTRTLVALCSGCYLKLRHELQEKGDYQAKMLTEIVLEAVQTQGSK